MKDIGILANEIVDAISKRKDDEVAKLLAKAINDNGDFDARMAVVRLCASRAGIARKENKRSQLICRLSHATFQYKPKQVSNRVIRELLVEAKAAGPLERESAPRQRRSILALTKG